MTVSVKQTAGQQRRDCVVLIDGECGLCSRTAKFLIRRDPRAVLRFAALGSKAAQNCLRDCGLDSAPVGTVVFVENGKAWFRSEAVLRAAGHLPAPWKFARWLCIVPRFLRDACYRLVAANRYWVFGRSAVCNMDAGISERFLPDGLA